MNLYLARIAPALIYEVYISVCVLDVNVNTTLTVALFHNLILPGSKECRADTFYRMLIVLVNLVHILVRLEHASLGRPNIGLTRANRLRIKSMSYLNGSPCSRLRLISWLLAWQKVVGMIVGPGLLILNLLRFDKFLDLLPFFVDIISISLLYLRANMQLLLRSMSTLQHFFPRISVSLIKLFLRNNLFLWLLILLNLVNVRVRSKRCLMWWILTQMQNSRYVVHNLLF